jgi:hypothetical protein
MNEIRNYDQIPRAEVDTNLDIGENSKYFGKAKFICNKKRLCGSSYGVLIVTFNLIILPTLLYLIVM